MTVYLEKEHVRVEKYWEKKLNNSFFKPIVLTM